MNNLLTFSFLCLFSLASQSQSSQNYSITYECQYKPLNGARNYKVFDFLVQTNGQNSLSQWVNRKKLDSIAYAREIENEDVSIFKDYDSYSIEIDKNNVLFLETVGGETYYYKDKTPRNWQLSNETKSIKGYACKKATQHYAGRDWTAWYAPSLPINAGPYKFKDLPGLIVKIHDSNYSYIFELKSISKIKSFNSKRTSFALSKGKPIKISRKDFLKFQHKFRSMTFNERIKFMNRNEEGVYSTELFSADGDSADFRNISFKDDINLIEQDYLEN